MSRRIFITVKGAPGVGKSKLARHLMEFFEANLYIASLQDDGKKRRKTSKHIQVFVKQRKGI